MLTASIGMTAAIVVILRRQRNQVAQIKIAPVRARTEPAS